MEDHMPKQIRLEPLEGSPLVLHNTATLTATGIGPISSDDVVITILDAQAREEFI